MLIDAITLGFGFAVGCSSFLIALGVALIGLVRWKAGE